MAKSLISKWQGLVDALSPNVQISTKKEDFGDCSDLYIFNVAEELYKCAGVRQTLSGWLSSLTPCRGDVHIEIMSVKDTAVATKLREEGNKIFKKDDFVSSLRLFNKSVLSAPRSDECFSLALANRATCLLKLSNFKEALEDFSLVLKTGYPEALRFKAYANMAECHFNLRDPVKGRNAFIASVEEFRKDSKNRSSCGAYKSSILARENKIINEILQIPIELTIEHSMEELHGLIVENNSLQGASKSLTLKESEKFGRFIEANADFKAGDVLFVEKPFAFVVLPGPHGLLSMVCDNCCKHNIQPIPCTDCCSSVYCTEECRLEGWEKFHQWECQGAQLNLWPAIGIGHLAMRILLIASNGQLFKTEGMGAETTAKEFVTLVQTQPEIIANKAYERVYGLLNNMDKFDDLDNTKYGLTSVMLTTYLKNYTNFFEVCAPKILGFNMDTREAEIVISFLILRHMGLIITNATKITGLCVMPAPQDQGIPEERQVGMASGIFPTTSLMNHSCYPNTSVSHYKNVLIVKAARDIKAGDEVSNCYGPVYTTTRGNDRRISLREQYMFECKCFACTDKKKDNFADTFHAFACKYCNGPVSQLTFICLHCNRRHNRAELTRAGKEIGVILLNLDGVSDRREKIKIINRALKKQRASMYKLGCDIRLSHDFLTNHFLRLGEVENNPSLHLANIKSLTAQFGKNSVQVAKELSKLLFLNLAQCLDTDAPIPTQKRMAIRARELAERTLKLYSLHYGPWTLEYVDTFNKLRCIMERCTELCI